MKETIFSLLKIVMIVSVVGLVFYILYVFFVPDKSGFPDKPDNKTDEKANNFKKTG